MLPIFYTRQYLLAQWERSRRANPDSMIYSARDHLYAVNRLASLDLPGGKGVIHMRTTMVHGGRNQQIFIGLLETASVRTAARSPGIGISVDLGLGLVEDLVNDQGVLGYLESAPFEANKPIEIGIEMEVFGRICLPRIIIGGESLLHPGLFLDIRENVSAMAGTTLNPLGDARFSDCRLEFETVGGLSASAI